MGKIKIICFLGVDGSGKSTLSNYLFNKLKESSDVSYTWWLEAENTLIRKIIRKVGNSVDSNLNEIDSDKEIQNKFNYKNKLFRFFYPRIVLLDYVFFGIKKTWIPYIRNKNKIMILDRYYYDVILALSEEFSFSEKAKFRTYNLFKKLFPDPDIIFVVEVPPKIAYLRKKDEIKSIQNAELIKSKYEKIYSIIDSEKIIKIDNTKELDFVKKKILTCLGEL